jgi:hypothetical protein
VARKSSVDAAKAKARKQKKIAIGLSVLLVLALAYALHTMLGMSGGSSAARPQAAATTTAAVAPTVAPPVPTPPSKLVDAVQPPADPGQLRSFSLFESKDPFDAGGPGTAPASAPPRRRSPSVHTASTAPIVAKAPASAAASAPAGRTAAVISVNGSSESVQTGADFPAAKPVFRLVSLAATSAKVAVAGGSYADGAQTITLKVATPVTLVNTADGTRYTLVLLARRTVSGAHG